MIESTESGTIITGEGITIYRVMTVRRGLILKIDTGINLTRMSCLSVAQRDGLTVKRTNRGALVDVNRWLELHGSPAVWSKRYPKG